MRLKKWIYRMVVNMMIKDRYKLGLTGKQKSILEGIVRTKVN